LRAQECDGIGNGTPNLGRWRDFFFIPIASGVLAGTTYTLADAGGMPDLAKSRAYQQLLDEINRARPDRQISKSDIRHCFWGMLPAALDASGSASSRLLDRDIIVDGEKKYGLPGYYRVQGVKLTTAFELAYRVVPLLLQYRSNSDQDDLKVSLDADVSSNVTTPMALTLTGAENIKKALGEMRTEKIRELVSYCVHREHAQTLEDLLQRRLGLLPFEYPDEDVRRILAHQLAEQLGWDNAKMLQELEHADSAVERSLARRFVSESPT
jgi:glycerol-3-phosphate dehydrogenase